MERRDEIGFQIRALSNLFKRQVDQIASQNNEKPTTGMQGWVIGYLYENRDKDIYQRDIQERFAIRRSTVTGMLKLMEKNELVTRTSVDSDARLKKISLTPRAVAMHEQIIRGINTVEERVYSGLDPDERATFIRLCEKIRVHLLDAEN